MEKIEKPWGWELIVEKNGYYVVKKLFMKKGHSCSLQYHEKKHETIYVIDGILKVLHGHSSDSLSVTLLNKGDVFVCEPKYIHRMTGEENCLYIECSTTEIEDVIRLKDDYGRDK